MEQSRHAEVATHAPVDLSPTAQHASSKLDNAMRLQRPIPSTCSELDGAAEPSPQNIIVATLLMVSLTWQSAVATARRRTMWFLQERITIW
jgi:hypothetical protein